LPVDPDFQKKRNIRSEEDIINLLRGKTRFERDVLVATFNIPKGKASTYKRIAQKIGRPRAYRAAGNALHKNPLAPIVPCHRVVRSDGGFGGDKKGVEARRKLLEQEGVPVRNGRVKISEEILF
jgi:O-6-methylguanine DNA methyltransferase